jgi:hypothetical protein
MSCNRPLSFPLERRAVLPPRTLVRRSFSERSYGGEATGIVSIGSEFRVSLILSLSESNLPSSVTETSGMVGIGENENRNFKGGLIHITGSGRSNITWSAIGDRRKRYELKAGQSCAFGRLTLPQIRYALRIVWRTCYGACGRSERSSLDDRFHARFRSLTSRGRANGRY